VSDAVIRSQSVSDFHNSQLEAYYPLMSHSDHAIPADRSREGDPPTLLGYLDYKSRIENKDHDLSDHAHEEWKNHLFQAKPAVVHYQELHWLERRLEQLSNGASYDHGKTDEFIKRIRAETIDHLKYPDHRRQAESLFREAHQKWNKLREASNAERATSYPQRMHALVEFRQSRTDTRRQTPDESKFWAKREIDGQYADKLENMDKKFEAELDSIMDRIVDRQIHRSEVGPKNLLEAFRMRIAEKGKCPQPDRDVDRER
jgi:hypothetical protein